MAVDGVLGNVKVAYSLSSPISWVNVPQLLDAQIPTFSREKIDTSVMGTSGFKRSIPGWNQVSDMTLKVLADLDETTSPAHAALASLNKAGTTVWWRVEIAVNRDSTKWKAWEFQGFVQEFKPVAPAGGREEIDITVGFDGTAFTVYNAGASAIS